MPLLLWLTVIAIVYVASFSNDFTKEKIDKALPFLIVVGLIVLVFGILSSWVGG
jgi:hypothetical protein